MQPQVLLRSTGTEISENAIDDCFLGSIRWSSAASIRACCSRSSTFNALVSVNLAASMTVTACWAPVTRGKAVDDVCHVHAGGPNDAHLPRY
jgi:hypothetical protein